MCRIQSVLRVGFSVCYVQFAIKKFVTSDLQQSDAAAVACSLSGSALWVRQVLRPAMRSVYLSLSMCIISLIVMPCPAMSCHVMSCLVMSCHVLSWHVMSCLVMSCHFMSSHVRSGPVISCHVVSCHAMSCHVMPCLVTHSGPIDILVFGRIWKATLLFSGRAGLHSRLKFWQLYGRFVDRRGTPLPGLS